MLLAYRLRLPPSEVFGWEPEQVMTMIDVLEEVDANARREEAKNR